MMRTGGEDRMLTGSLYRHGAASQAATSELRQLLNLSGEHARALRLQQLPPHLDLAIILDGLPRLEELQLSCGQQDLQMGYDRDLFGLPAARCRAISQCLGRLQALTHLDLSMNLLDDAKVDMLAEGLNRNTAIISLILHSNKIRDPGAATLARFVESHASCAYLDVHDNMIQADGARAMGRALHKEECRLTSLNMRLNELGEEGGQALAVGLQNNRTLKRLDIGANKIGPSACTAFAGVLQSNSTLQELDLSCNPLASGEGGWLLHEAIKANQFTMRASTHLTIAAFMLLGALGSAGAGRALAPSPSATKSKSWTVEISLPQNCTANTQTTGYTLQSCKDPCDVNGPTHFYLSMGTSINISFKTKPTLVVIGGSQNLQFLNDEIPDMNIWKAPAPPNPIVDQGFTGFTFAPRQKYFAMFKNGILAKLAIYAFDTSASPGKSSSKGLATYKSAACRMFLYVEMTSRPANETVDPNQLYIPKDVNTSEMAARKKLLTKVLIPTLICGLLLFICIVGCLLTHCAQQKEGPEKT
ncbi:probable Dynein regulatory complex subunit 5 at N-terminal half [Coccomyxa sp. Obi]|nr:probable Dynein regulatory complex subunit 5 at N-terminal half [Coccomyxa sp. Obi]